MKIKFSDVDLEYHLLNGTQSLCSSENKRTVENYYIKEVLKKTFDDNSIEYVLNYTHKKEIISCTFLKNKELFEELDSFNIEYFENKFNGVENPEKYQLILKTKFFPESLTSIPSLNYDEIENLLVDIKRRYGFDFFETIYIRNNSDILDFENMPRDANLIRESYLNEQLSLNLKSAFITIEKYFEANRFKQNSDDALDNLVKDYEDKKEKNKKLDLGVVKDTNIIFNQIIPYDESNETALFQVLHKEKEIGFLNITGNPMLPCEFNVTFEDTFKDAMVELKDYHFSSSSANISSDDNGLYHDEDLVFDYKNNEVTDENLLGYFMSDLSSYVDDWKDKKELVNEQTANENKTKKLR